MTLAVEEKRILNMLDQVEVIEKVADTFDEDDERRSQLLSASNVVLADLGAVRVVTAARLLGVTEKTVRAWASKGILTVAKTKPRLLLDAASVHEVIHLVQAIKEAGRDRDLLDEIGRRLRDQALIAQDDFQESLAQMHRGEYAVLRPAPKPDADGR